MVDAMFRDHLEGIRSIGQPTERRRSGAFYNKMSEYMPCAAAKSYHYCAVNRGILQLFPNETSSVPSHYSGLSRRFA